MANGHDKLIRLHANLVKDGYELPEFKVFQADMADSNNLKKLHGTLVNDGYELPDVNTFRADMGFFEKKNLFGSLATSGAFALGSVGSKNISGKTPSDGLSNAGEEPTQLINGV